MLPQLPGALVAITYGQLAKLRQINVDKSKHSPREDKVWIQFNRLLGVFAGLFERCRRIRGVLFSGSLVRQIRFSVFCTTPLAPHMSTPHGEFQGPPHPTIT